MNPRYSIIPAGAVTDPRIEPRDLQVLCLLGRHIDDLGWCRRSQVKMAREIGCARSTLQGSLDRLVDAEWVEKHVAPSEGKGTTAYSYRVRLDVNEGDSYYRDLPQAGRVRNGRNANGQSENGADIAAGVDPADLSAPPVPPQERHPLPIHASAPLTSPDKRFEREAREGEGRGVRFQAPDDTEASARFDKLIAIYPPGSIGDVNAARKAFVGLSLADQEAAIEAWPRVRSGMRKEGRDHVFSVRTYLGNRDWERFPKPISASGTVDDRVTFLPFSRAAWALFRRAFDSRKNVEFALRWIRSGAAVPPSTFPTEEEQNALVAIEVGSPEQIAWRDHCRRLGFTLPIPDSTEWIFLPAKTPPPLSLAWKGYHTIEPVDVEARSAAWWWRLYQEGVPQKALQDALDSRLVGNIRLSMGPIPLPNEVASMIRIEYGHPSFHSWDMWFALKGCKTLGALSGPIYVPCENPALMRGRGTDTDEDVTRIDAEVEEVV